jgi:NADPH-dependent glutamate synthase beta subunit-like oxidoreductase
MALTDPQGSEPDGVTLRVEVPGDRYYRDLIPCQSACPVGTDARGYVRAIAEGRFEEAYLLARGPNPFASICGRICGAPCEAACRRGKIPITDDDGRLVGLDRPIAIRALKRFACEQAGVDARPPADVLESLRENVPPPLDAGPEEMAALLRAFLRGGFEPAAGEKVAIIGAGPAGLSAAHDLALMGFRPTVFEMEPVGAGMLAVGVPGYRLPRDLIEREIDVIRALGVEIRCGVQVGRDVSFARLRSDHAAVIIAVGAKRPRALGLPGERGPRVYGGVDFLRWVALDEPVDLGRDVVVIGGGNVAYDVARTVLRQIAYDTARTAARRPGTERVRLASLETLEEMPADTVEIREGDEEGIERVNGWGPVEIRRDGDGRVTGVLLQRCLRVYDEKHRFAPVFDPGERQMLDCDTVLLATGQATDLSFLRDGGEDVREFRPGWPQVDPETLATTAPGVFVAGDLAHGTRLLIDAVASGKRAARSVFRHVTGRSIAMEALESHVPIAAWRREPGYEALRRVAIPTREAPERLADPRSIVEIGYGEGAARREASRCLDCGVSPVFDGTRCVLCGGCVDVCPTLCLKLAGADEVEGPGLLDALRSALGPGADPAQDSVILKDEDRCIRCGLCAMRCPTDAITMERYCFSTRWRPA